LKVYLSAVATMLVPSGVEDAMEEQFLVAAVGSELLTERGLELGELLLLTRKNDDGFGGQPLGRGVLGR